jgi:hypothetical protein
MFSLSLTSAQWRAARGQLVAIAIPEKIVSSIYVCIYLVKTI